jgi:hypothetical protein
LGLDAKHPEPFNIDYVQAPKHHLYDEDGGYDFGFLLLNQNQIRLLQKNDIVPLNEGNWQHQAGVEFFHYALVGFPNQGMDLEDPRYARIKPYYISLERLADVPPSLRRHNVPMCYARIPNPPPGLSIKGMSGSPIFGFTKVNETGAAYYFVAIQSGWFPDPKVVYACQIPFLGKLLQMAVDNLAAEIQAHGAATPESSS